MEGTFTPILDDNETIVKEYKPNKLKHYFSTLVIVAIPLLFFSCFIAFALFMPSIVGQSVDAIFCIIPIGVFVVGMTIATFLVRSNYNKAYYVVTNKRVIIRTGIIGVDYKSLDMSMIGAIDVYVSFIDRLIKKDTGSIRFGSASSPIAGQNVSAYAFKHVTAPYAACKEIKVYIDEIKAQKQA